MNVLSFASVTVAILFMVLFIKQIPNCKGDLLVKFSMGVFFTLAWWNFCDAFFYVASTMDEAWAWYRLGAIGWNGFISVTAYYFIVMCGDHKYWNTKLRQFIYWTPAVLLTILFMMPGIGVLADNLIQSKSGLGWAYQQSFTTIWPFVFLMEIAIYMGIALFRVYLWQRKAVGEGIRILSIGFIILDGLSVAVGILLIFIMPMYSDFLPSMSFLPTGLFLFGYWNKIIEHDLMHIETALDPGDMFENSLDAILVTDQSWRILYGNQEAKNVLKESVVKGKNFINYLANQEYEMLHDFVRSKEHRSRGLDLVLENNVQVLCSISRTMTKNRGHQVYILSMHDASGLRKAQKRLQYLADYDELTGLPNRRRLGEMLDEWENYYIKSGKDFSILFLDLNRFKKINDEYGHVAGDQALRAVAHALKEGIPPKDVVTRLAGDEFIILHAPDMGELEDTVFLIRQLIRGVNCNSFAPGVQLEAAIGVCSYSEAGNIRRLFKLADERMYELKGKKLRR